MSSFKLSLLLCLLLLAASSLSHQGADAARLISSSQSQNDGQKHHYMWVPGTLGVVCKCCDGPDGSCTSSWSVGCSNLQCLPWKQA